MSSTPLPPATPDPLPPDGAVPLPAPMPDAFTPGETAPSGTFTGTATLTRAVGIAGLFCTVLGLVVIVTTRAIGPRIVSEGFGFVFAGFGLALLLYHAVTDT